MDSKGQLILHGGNKTIPYISPGLNYGRYLAVGVKRALDAGAQAIHLEEPEFCPPPDGKRTSNANGRRTMATREPAELFGRRTLSQFFDFAQDHGKRQGRTIRCCVPTHSLINYANWRIVSPESSLIQVDSDGYIAQVWTGTARTPISTKAGAASALSKPPSSNTVPGRTSYAPQDAASGSE